MVRRQCKQPPPCSVKQLGGRAPPEVLLSSRRSGVAPEVAELQEHPALYFPPRGLAPPVKVLAPEFLSHSLFVPTSLRPPGMP